MFTKRNRGQWRPLALIMTVALFITLLIPAQAFAGNGKNELGTLKIHGLFVEGDYQSFTAHMTHPVDGRQWTVDLSEVSWGGGSCGTIEGDSAPDTTDKPYELIIKVVWLDGTITTEETQLQSSDGVGAKSTINAWLDKTIKKPDPGPGPGPEHDPTGSLTIIKTVGEGVTEPAFSFRVAGSEDSQDTTVMAGSYTIIPNLPYGEYTITELNAAAYNLTMTSGNQTVINGSITVTIGNDSPNVSVSAHNESAPVYEPGKGALTINKTVGQGVSESAFGFRVTCQDNGYDETTQVTAGTPLAIPDLEYGEYTVEELNADSYVLTMTSADQTVSNGPITVTIGEGSQGVVVNALNERIPDPAGSITIYKTVGEGVEAPAFTFLVEGDGFSQEVKVDVNGSATINDLPFGAYTVTELYADGYDLTMTAGAIYAVNEAITITIDEENPEIAVEAHNALVPEIVPGEGTLTIIKTIGAGVTETTFSFSVTGEGYSEIVSVTVGTPALLHLPYGQYTVAELNAAGYNVTMSPSNGVVTIGEDTPNVSVAVTNQLIPEIIRVNWDNGTADIPDIEVPLVDVPEDEVPLADIFEDEVPLALPKTGETAGCLVYLVGVSIAALGMAFAALAARTGCRAGKQAR